MGEERLQHELRLMTTSVDEKGQLRVPVDALIEVLDKLLRLARQVLTFHERGAAGRGRQPTWVRNATEWHISKLESGSMKVQLEVPQLEQVLDAEYEDSWAVDLRSMGSAVDVTFKMIKNSLRDPSSVISDSPLLKAMGKMGRVIEEYGGLTVTRSGQQAPWDVDVQQAKKLRAMSLERRPQVERFLGRLDTLSLSRDKIGIQMEDEVVIDGRLTKGFGENYRELMGKNVLIQGRISRDIRGRMKSVKVQWIRKATEEDRRLWTTASTIQTALPLPRPGVMAHYIGSIPAYDSDVDIEAMLKELD